MHSSIKSFQVMNMKENSHHVGVQRDSNFHGDLGQWRHLVLVCIELQNTHSMSTFTCGQDISVTTTNIMNGTKVPNSQRSSACDCTRVLTRNRSLSCDSLMLAMRIVLFLPMQSSLTSF